MVMYPFDSNSSYWTYCARIAYDGTHYHGWQHQDGLRTVEGVLHEAFYRAFQVHMSLLAASRTDAGVHAYDQVVRFQIPFYIEPLRLAEIWNRVLPESIIVRSISIIETEFHPRYDVVQKEYWYHVFTQRPLPFFAYYGWYYGPPFNENILENCLHHIVGTHDFRSFCTGTAYESTIRTIDYAALQHIARYNTYRIVIRGKRFMHFMIRRIVGAALMSATHTLYGEQKFLTVFKERNPRNNLPTAPAQGLLLRKISYKKGDQCLK